MISNNTCDICGKAMNWWEFFRCHYDRTLDYDKQVWCPKCWRQRKADPKKRLIK